MESRGKRVRISDKVDPNLDFGVPRYPLNDVEGVADFLIRHFKLAQAFSKVQQGAAS